MRAGRSHLHLTSGAVLVKSIADPGNVSKAIILPQPLDFPRPSILYVYHLVVSAIFIQRIWLLDGRAEEATAPLPNILDVVHSSVLERCVIISCCLVISRDDFSKVI